MASRILIALATGAALVATSSCGSRSSAGAGANLEEGIGVNAFLWRSTLDTLSFMPLASADPWGGVVNTDWYANPEKTG